MLFKDLKQNYPVYALDKQELAVYQGKATSIGFPRYDANKGYSQNQQMVVDVTIEINGKSATYTIPESLSVTYAGNLVLSTDREGLSREIESMKNTAEQIIASVDRQKTILDKSSKLLAELSPEYRAKKETEERFTKIEGSVSEMKNMLEKFINEFKS